VVVDSPDEIDGDTIEADVVIVGSGAAGSVLAHRLAERGRDVVMLERGSHVDPSTFVEDEKTQLTRLYRDGALQVARNFRFQVLQGVCVGGTTVINNAVCFDIPPRVLRRWNDHDGLDAGLDEERLARSFQELRSWLPVTPQTESAYAFHQPGAAKFDEGIKALGLDRDGEYDVVDANVTDCLGSGYCNIGCAWGKKLSALDRILPAAQAVRPGAVRIVSDCDVREVERQNGRATGVACRLPDDRSLRVNAQTVVVSAGALASSLLLRRSGFRSRVGDGMSFNLATPLTADFDEELNAYAGMQICRYLAPAGHDGLVVETWFNPPMMQSLFMPGWFDQHYENMRRYSHMTCVGVVVGSHADGRVRKAFLKDHPDLEYEPGKQDLDKLVEGMKLAGRVFFAAGAKRVMPPTFGYLEITSPDQLDDLDRHVKSHGDLLINSAHPQGGNAISRDREKGVVDDHFRVWNGERPMENLYVCDASVFPSSLTVNPQLTVMALAAYAAETIE
jgi:choline dehydrogenase-like flavoprotein